MNVRQWKPGDVALVTLGSDSDGRAHASGPVVAIRDNVGSWACGAAVGRHVMDDEISSARTLVVIDPDDRKQVERLRQEFNLVSGQNYKGEWVPDMQKALHRAFIADPKPDEPLGLGAVVLDANGTRWIRSGTCGLDWVTEFNTETHPWSAIAAVRVLSEGVVTDA